MFDTTRQMVPEDVVKANTEWATLQRLLVGDMITTAREPWSIPAGELWYVAEYSRNGWITLIKQHATGMNCWDDVPGDTRKVRATGWTVRRVTHAFPFHHIDRG